MKTRITKRQKTPIPVEYFESAMALYADSELREAEINTEIENHVNNFLAVYEDELALLAESKSIAFNLMQEYCTDNKEDLFSQRRSIATLRGIAGFRLGTPRLKTIPGSDWKKVLKQLKEKLPEYVRTTEEPAKDQLLADRHKENVVPLLMEIGVEVVQDELFYVEIKKAA